MGLLVTPRASGLCEDTSGACEGRAEPGAVQRAHRQVLAVVSNVISDLSYQGPSLLVCIQSLQCSLGMRIF